MTHIPRHSAPNNEETTVLPVITERPRPGSRLRVAVRTAGELLITFGLIVLLLVGYELWGKVAIINAHQHDLDQQLSQALLVCAAAALLWYVAFPAIDPYLPFNDGGVTSQDGPPGQDSVVPGTTASPAPAPSGSPSTR